MKKFILGLVLVSVYLFVGFKPVQLRDRAIVQSIGIDYSNNLYKITMLYYSPPSGGGENTAQTDALSSKILSASGRTIDEAFGNSTLKQGKVNFYGHNNVIIIGENAAKTSLNSILSFINGNPELITDVEFLVSKTTAEDILNKQTDESILPTMAIMQVTEGSKKSGIIPDVRFIDIIRGYVSPDEDIVIPCIEISKEEVDKWSYNASGGLVYTDKFEGYLNTNEVQGLNLIANKIEQFSVDVVTDDNSKVSISLFNTIKNYEINSKTLNIKCNGIITSVSPIVSSVKKEKMDEIKKKAEQKISDMCQISFNKLSNIYNANIINIKDIKECKNIITQVNIDVSGSIPINT